MTLDEASIREWISSGKFCSKEDVTKSKKKKQVRDHSGKYPHLDLHIREFIRKKGKIN